VSRSTAVLAALATLSVVSVAAVAPPAVAQSSDPAAIAISNVTASTETPTAGEPFSLRVTVSNYEGSPSAATINQLVVRVDGDRQYVADDLGRLTAGSQTTVTVPVTVDDPGQQTIRLALYGNSDGGLVNAQAPFVVDVRDAQRPSLSVSVPDAVPGTTRDVNVTVANGVDGPVENVVVTADSTADGVAFDETTRVRGRMAGGETRSFSFPAKVRETGEYAVDVSLAYTDDGRRRTVNRTFETRFGAPSNPGRVVLSGVEATQRAGTVEISATASNVGGTEVGGVVVGVAASAPDAVRRQTYFVGSVEASGFSTFTLRTSATERVSSIPVAVTYVESGVERTTTTEVPVDAAAPPEPAREPSGGGGLLSLGTVGPVLVGLLVLVVGGVVYRRRG
jgi:VCBS repeat-containing protein